MSGDIMEYFSYHRKDHKGEWCAITINLSLIEVKAEAEIYLLT